jgi:hypothetical protein
LLARANAIEQEAATTFETLARHMEDIEAKTIRELFRELAADQHAFVTAIGERIQALGLTSETVPLDIRPVSAKTSGDALGLALGEAEAAFDFYTAAAELSADQAMMEEAQNLAAHALDLLKQYAEGAMRILAGARNGVYVVADGASRRVLESGVVRDLTDIGDRLYAGTDTGLHVSDNGGETWSSSGLTGRHVWQVRAAGNGTLYASTQPAGLFRSDNGGRSWDEVDGFIQFPQAADWCIPVTPPIAARARALVVDRDDPDMLWVGVEVGGIMRSGDAGKTWELDQPGENPDLHMIFAHPERPEVLYASTGYGRLDGVAEQVEGNAGVLRSDDRGATWTYKDDGGAQAMLFRSEDGGETWRSLCDAAHSPSAANIHGLAPDPEAPGGVLAGTDTGEVWRVSNEAEWTAIGTGLPAVASVLAI